MIETDKRTSLWVLMALSLLPAFQTAVSVHWQWHTPITYPALKAVIIAMPIVVWLAIRRPRREVLELTGCRRTNLLPGLVAGAILAAAILGSYYAVLRPIVDPTPVAAKVRSMGLLERYWLMAAVVSLWNSLVEEYYWRAFLLGELRRWTGRALPLCVLCGALFGLHHIFALAGVLAPSVTALCVLGTMIAGGVWSWMRLRGYSIADCYVSHVIADLSVFWVGYDLITRSCP